MDRILYGAAYYDEYMPYDRLDTDIAMMKKAGINVIRIAESTWSTCEPQDGVFDFSHVERVLDEVVFLQQGRVLGHEAVDDIRAREGKSVDDVFRDMFRANPQGGDYYAG